MAYPFDEMECKDRDASQYPQPIAHSIPHTIGNSSAPSSRGHVPGQCLALAVLGRKNAKPDFLSGVREGNRAGFVLKGV